MCTYSETLVRQPAPNKLAGSGVKCENWST